MQPIAWNHLRIMRTKRFSVFGFVMVAMAALYSLWHWRLDVSIERFLPLGTQTTFARNFTTSSLARTLVINIGGSNIENVVDAANQLKQQLLAHPEVERVVSGVDERLQEDFFRLYFPRRHYFVSMQPESDIPELISDQGLRQRAAELKRALGQPTGALQRRLADRDPLMLFAHHLDRLTRGYSTMLPSYRGQLLSKDKRYAVLFVTTRHSAFSTSHQVPFLDALSQHWNAIKRPRHRSLTLQYSGVHRFAVQAEREIKQDLRVLSAFSSLATLCLFLGVFASLGVLFLVWLPLGVGTLCAVAVTLAIFGSIHGITLAFGTALIGVCVNYSVHYFSHHALVVKSDPSATDALRVPLTLGAVTTVMGFAGLVAVDAPGIRQIAIFASVGVFIALITTLFVLPEWAPKNGQQTKALRSLLRHSDRLFAFLKSRRNQTVMLVVLGSSALLAFGGLSRLTWDTSLAAFHPPHPQLLKQEEQVRARSSVMDSSRMVITTAKSERELLLRSDAISTVLRSARDANELQNCRDLTPWLWSESLQKRNQELLQAAPDLKQRMQRAFAAAGFRTETLNFQEAIQSKAKPLTLADVTHSGLAAVIDTHIMRTNDQLALAVFLQGVKQPQALAKRIAEIPHASYIDHKASLQASYERYRTQILSLIAAGLAAIFLVLLVRYRRPPKALAAFLPAVVAAVATLGILAWLGIPLTLMHALAIVLVLSMGVDYGIFLAETDPEDQGSRVTLVGVLLDCFSTMLTFGALMMSSIPALQAIGLTTAIGIAWSLVLAPVAFVLTHRRRVRIS